MKTIRTVRVTAGIAHGAGACLTTYEREDNRDVCRIVVELTVEDMPHLEAALTELRTAAAWQATVEASA